MNSSSRAAALVCERQLIENLRAFFVRITALKQTEAAKCDAMELFLRRLRDEPGLRKKEEEWEGTMAPHFNIFRVLRIQRRETKLHSRFLAELLNPRGSHGQGDLFLRRFVEMVEVEHGHPLLPGTASRNLLKWEVTPEKVIESGRLLDLVLTGRIGPGNRQFIAVIENKVDAREQTAQCRHYWEWLTEQPDTEFCAIFLTPDGHKPETDPSGDWICLSYRQHIRSWLEETIDNEDKKIHAPHLRLAIEQYLQIVKSL